MARNVMNTFVLLTALTSVRAYWLMGAENFITTERLDPIVNPGRVSGHAHSVLGGSNFRMNTNTAELRESECTSIPIPEDKSNYWFPHLYFQWADGTFTSLSGGAVICTTSYDTTFDKPGTTTAFPDDFRMLSGDPTLRTYDPNSYAQQAITFLCLDFNGVTTRHNSLPAKVCPSGIRAQVNFPSCWDGKNLDSPDHKSHVAFPSGGPDSGSCSDPKYPVTLPRIFIEVYWNTEMDKYRSQAMNSSQPYVYSYGDPTGYGYHADFMNGWDKGVLQRAVEECNCNIYGDPTCCVEKGIFHMNKGQQCHITKTVDEATTGTLAKLPGNNPVQKEGVRATMFTDPNQPALLSPVYAYTGDAPAMVGKPVPPAAGGPASSFVPPSSSSAGPASSSAPAPPSSSSVAATSISYGPASSPVPSPEGALPSSVRPPANGPAPPASGYPAGVHQSPTQTPSSAPVASPARPSPTLIAIPSHTGAVAAPPVPSPSDTCDDEEEGNGETDGENGDDDVNTCAGQNDGDGGHTPAVSAQPLQSPSPTKAPPVPSAPAPPASASPSDDDEDCEEQDGDEDHPLHPPSAGADSNPRPHPGSGYHPGSSSAPRPPVLAPLPATTLVAGAGQGSGVPQSSSPTAGFSSSAPMCPGGKFRHKRLREQKAQEHKRALHHARLFHENGRPS
ncbi:putative wsc domain-containing protein [Lyophyllum shimeji]|uniref:Wsc domain-containing protein n=1 Tax=Lyophyllum shimeji TaxID=47721 RepID=A0A9P3UU41_LYOSH|nr:putative wsc domain-containing protein [Lyophyllum shimeji]